MFVFLNFLFTILFLFGILFWIAAWILNFWFWILGFCFGLFLFCNLSFNLVDLDFGILGLFLGNCSWVLLFGFFLFFLGYCFSWQLCLGFYDFVFRLFIWENLFCGPRSWNIRKFKNIFCDKVYEFCCLNFVFILLCLGNLLLLSILQLD